MQKNILLTGISGFIGRNIANRLLEAGHRLYAPMRRQSLSKIKSLITQQNLTVLEGNFYDDEILRSVKNFHIDTVLHFASIRGEGNASADDYQQVNVQATQNLLQFAVKSGVGNFLYCSSVGVLGTIPKQQPAGRSMPVDPDNIYHQTKWMAEKLVNDYREKGLKTIILRPTITYGKGDDGFVVRLISLINSSRLPLSSKQFSIHLLDVQALSDLTESIISRQMFNNQTYIIADKSPVVFSELVEWIGRLSGGKCRRTPGFLFIVANRLLSLARMNGLHTSMQLISRDWTYDISDTVNELGYKPADTFKAMQPLIEETE